MNDEEQPAGGWTEERLAEAERVRGALPGGPFFSKDGSIGDALIRNSDSVSAVNSDLYIPGLAPAACDFVLWSLNESHSVIAEIRRLQTENGRLREAGESLADAIRGLMRRMEDNKLIDREERDSCADRDDASYVTAHSALAAWDAAKEKQ